MKAEEFAACEPDEVLNQPPALENYNLYACDRPLREAVAREGGRWVDERAREFGALLGKAENLKLGELANRYPPVLRTHDRFGHRLDAGFESARQEDATLVEARLKKAWARADVPLTASRFGK